MLVVGIVISAVSMFLGLFTKFPQGGGGLVNNLMALTFFLPAPPLPPLPLQKRILFDLETAIAENQLFYLSNPVVTRNGTYGPMPRFLQNPRSAADGRNASASNATFTFPTFSFPTFSPPEELTEFWKSIGMTIMVFMALCLPWLVIKVMNLLEKTGPALPAASKPMLTGFGERVAQIEPISPLLQDLRIIISERDRAFTDLQSSIKRAREAKKEASEKNAEKEEAMEGMHFELNRALTELQKEKEMVAKVEEEKEKKIEELRDEISSQMKAWEDKAAKLAEEAKRGVDGFREETSREIVTLAEKVAILEEEKKREADGLREEASNQMNAWMDSEKKWEEERADEDERHNEAINSLKMGQEQEIESWRKQVENLKNAVKVAEEASVAKLKKILERMEKEKEGWEIEKEAWKEEKKEMTKEKKEVEEKREEERKFWAEGSDRAQRQINQLEAETQTLKEKVADGQKKVAEAEEARETAEAKNKRGQVETEKAAKESIAKLGQEVVNGRKLIDDLQADKRRDRQLLLELRAQHVRPTHATPPSHMNPLRFAGFAPPSFMRGPSIAGSTSIITPTGPSTFRATNPSEFSIANPLSSGFASQSATPLPSQLPSSRPIIRLPPTPAQLARAKSAPKG